ncbi:hypothetical protein VTL71DRAFT_827 [Oculimacula yallundae]|uniref:Uncharacterized protein n=1 Tax=Oculimacula yallundae TaxID=86028 RepID=A0ABR4D1C8_9HELO
MGTTPVKSLNCKITTNISASVHRQFTPPEAPASSKTRRSKIFASLLAKPTSVAIRAKIVQKATAFAYGIKLEGGNMNLVHAVIVDSEIAPIAGAYDPPPLLSSNDMSSRNSPSWQNRSINRKKRS